MANWEKTPPDGPVLQGFEILATHPHDPDAFTQGLAWHAGHLFEGTGRIGTSWLRKVVLETGEVTQEHVLAGRLFGELRIRMQHTNLLKLLMKKQERYYQLT